MRLAIILLLLFSVTARPQPVPPPESELCLPNQPPNVTCVAGAFARYWQSNGGLPVFGYAIGAAQPERNRDSTQEYLTQWTERNRLELHPENRPPYDILLGRMGAERLAQLGRDPALEGREQGPAAGCLWFEQTGHNVCDQAPNRGFKTYWTRNGLNIAGMDRYRRSLALFGLPLTAATPERDANGETVLTQWFERARFEWRPGNPDPYKVQLGLLGSEVRAAAPPPAQTPSIFGLTISQGYVRPLVGRAVEARVSWVRNGSISWEAIEPKKGVRDWSKAALTESELKTLAERGLTPIVVVQYTPLWAQQRRGHSCGAIKPEALDAFASFMHDVVARYSAPPYNIKYWEIGNEPDVDPSLVSPTSGYGCWGNAKDQYYGGGYYAEMLKRVYPAIKQANPAAQVISGGLLMDCDPTNPLPGKSCASGRFFEGILLNGGAPFFDIVSYHGYAFWDGKQHDWDAHYLSWEKRGGSMLGKLRFLRELMAQYHVDKPVLLTEVALLCYQSNPACQANFFEAQANHLVRAYARASANQLLGAVWYTLEGPGWEKSGLLDENQSPRPAYRTLSFISGLLQNASYAGPRSSGDVEGYAFRRGATRYEIYWTNVDTHVALPLPAGARAVYAVSGDAIPISGPTVDVQFNPIIVEITG